MRLVTTATLAFILGSTSAYAVEITHKGEQVDVPVCGGFLGLVCKETDWCDYPDGVICGAVDQFGTCRPRPEICTEEDIPVCGCDGETHSNACKAAQNGTDVAYPGECRGDGKNAKE